MQQVVGLGHRRQPPLFQVGKQTRMTECHRCRKVAIKPRTAAVPLLFRNLGAEELLWRTEAGVDVTVVLLPQCEVDEQGLIGRALAVHAGHTAT